jgi:hypothetical protein
MFVQWMPAARKFTPVGRKFTPVARSVDARRA